MHADMTGEEWDDGELGRALGIGILVGVPLMFLIAVLLQFQVAGEVKLLHAAGVALLPAFFVGPYVGGLFLMARSSSRHEAHGATTH